MKQEIFNYITSTMTAQGAFPSLQGKIYWANTRLEEAKKPYLLMTVINDDEIHRTSEVDGLVKEYRQATITFRICLDSETFANDELCEQMISFLRAKLSSEEAVDYFQALSMSNRWENISSTRDMTEAVNGGYIYIREFDIPFEYVATLQQGVKESKGVNGTISADGVLLNFSVDSEDEND